MKIKIDPHKIRQLEALQKSEPYRQAYWPDCPCDMCQDYTDGRYPPNYPCPVIRQGFEWGQDYETGEILIIHWYQGAYYNEQYVKFDRFA